ncbi:MAG: hypothetical protein ABIT16_02240 [Croceibacterium sp.]
MMRQLALLIVPMALAASPVAAQDTVRIDPTEAAQCAVWSSIVGGSSSDAETQKALTYALNYFIGYYEAATGHSIDGALSDEQIVVVANDVPGYAARCSQHMTNYGGRMVTWGAALTALGERLQAAQGGK